MTHEIPLRALPEKIEGDNSLWVAHFGGSFNPVHNGHIDIGRTLLEKYSFDRVVYVPNSSRYPKPGLASEAVRFALLQMSIEDEPRFEACGYELGKNDWTEPFETIMHLKNKYKQEAEDVRMFTVRGDDWLPSMRDWTSELVEHEGQYEFAIVPRENSDSKVVTVDNGEMNIISRMSFLMEAQEPLDVSSSIVREKIERQEIDDLPVPLNVREEIGRRGLYLYGITANYDSEFIPIDKTTDK